MKPLVWTATFERLGEPEVGIWCDRCNLPSGASFSMSMEMAGQLSVLTVTRCVDCCEPIGGPR